MEGIVGPIRQVLSISAMSANKRDAWCSERSRRLSNWIIPDTFYLLLLVQVGTEK